MQIPLVLRHASKECMCFKMIPTFLCVERSSSYLILLGLAADFLFSKVELHSAKDEEILKPSPFVNWELPCQ